MNNFMLKNIVLLQAFEKVPIFALYFNSTQFRESAIQAVVPEEKIECEPATAA